MRQFGPVPQPPPATSGVALGPRDCSHPRVRLPLAVLFLFLMSIRGWCAAIPDEPFWQDVSEPVRHSTELQSVTFRKLVIDRENTVYVLTDRGVARVYDDTLALDRSYRPLAGKPVLDIAVSPEGEVYHLFADHWLSNGQAGEPFGKLPPGQYDHLTVGPAGKVFLSGPGRWAIGGKDGPETVREIPAGRDIRVWSHPDGDHPVPITDGKLALIGGAVDGVTSLAFRGTRMWIGTHTGLATCDPWNDTRPPNLETRLPWPDITSLHAVTNGVWVGTARGVFFRRDGPTPASVRNGTVSDGAPLTGESGIRYYAGRRWLRDDGVVDLATDRDGCLWVLTQTGLNRIAFRRMTLAQKADWYDRKVRTRNLRYGFTGERHLSRPGDITSSELIDTDNDGGWTSYYLGSLAAHYAVTHGEEVRRQAWDSFAALERLQTIHTNTGFPARTFERKGFKYSDPDRWRDAPDAGWEWKGHTSSDEICSQTFAHAVMWEWVARDAAERRRIATNYVRIVDHILAHDLYLVDVDGKPTLWGRWNPEYVNWFPPSIVDRRLNSAEITASLQLAFRMTGEVRYRDRAYELFQRHGYLTNIMSPMSLIALTPGFIHQGNDMGDEWNHSDDELGFFTYWVLARFAFTPELKARYLAAIRDHWESERPERYPIWNFIYAACGGESFDPEGAVWTLRGVPLDTLTWTVTNSHRQDLTRLPKSFLGREMKELLPPGERLMARINTQPFILDQGDGGATDLPGDEFLIGYWLGRQVGAIGDQ